MASEQFSNGPQTTLSAAIADGSVTSITVTATTGFPSSAQFRIRIDSELLLVTNLSGTTWTVTRGIESTTAVSHSNGATVLAVLTAGALGTTSDAAAGTPSLRALGTGSTQACAGNDSRLSDSRTPTAHATTHKSGGSDPIKLDELAAPTDVTTLNSSTTAHGLLPKLDNNASHFLNGQGGWTTPSGTTYSADESTLTLSGTTFSEKTNGTTNAKLAQMPANTIKGNNSGSTANAADLTVAQVLAMLLPGILPPYGLSLFYVSSTTVTVKPGKAIDSTGSAILNLSADTTLTINTPAAINGNDRKTLSGTVTTNNTSAVVGSGTAFLTNFGTRAGSGTITGATTTLTGTNTKFLSELSVGDLIGTASQGYSRVTAIASDTSCTLVAALPGGSPGGAAYNIIENATFNAASRAVARVNTITDNTHLSLSASAGSSASGLSAYAGDCPADAAGIWYCVWLVNGSSGTGVIASTQRTTPYGVTNYNTYQRRIGVLRWNSTIIVAFSQYGKSNERMYLWEIAQDSQGSRIVNGANPGNTWTAADASVLVPPTSRLALINAIQEGAFGGQSYVRPRGVGEASVSRPSQIFAVMDNNMFCGTDGAQVVEYACSANGATFYIDLTGFVEDLNV
jgi:hypothetical protein